MRNAASSLRTIATAQADFRVNDRDGNHVNDYWRPDIAGLYALEVEGQAIKLIELSTAAADDHALVNLERHAVKSPKAGFWVRALKHEDEITRGPDRFAACCFPERLVEGRLGTYAISEENILRKKVLGHADGLGYHPTHDRFKAENWEWID